MQFDKISKPTLYSCLLIYLYSLNRKHNMKQTIFTDFKNKNNIGSLFELNDLIHEKTIFHISHKISFTEFIWIKIDERLNDFGLLDKYKKAIQKQFLTPFPIEQLLNLEDIKLHPKTKEHITNQKEQQIEKIRKEINSNDNIAKMERMPLIHISILAYNIIEFIITRNHLTFLIDKNWLVYAWNENYYQEYLEAGIDIKFKHHISISLPEIMKDFILESAISENYPSLRIINDDENKVLELLSQKQIKTLTIRLNNKKIKLIEATEIYNTVDKASRFVDQIMKGGYQNIQYSTQNGNITHFEKTTKYKIN